MDSLKGFTLPVICMLVGLVLLILAMSVQITITGNSIAIPPTLWVRIPLGLFGLCFMVIPGVSLIVPNLLSGKRRLLGGGTTGDDAAILPSTASGQTPSEIEFVSSAAVEAAGLTGFYPERHFYHTARRDRGNIDTYVASATKNVTLVSINLATGLHYDALTRVLEEKLVARGTHFRATISLLDPRKLALMEAIAPVMDVTPSALAGRIKESLQRLITFKDTLPREARARFELRVHGALPFGSAIIIDDGESFGRIQIETKPYKAAQNKSFAFEVAPAGPNSLYFSLVAGYTALLNDGEGVGIDTTF